MMDNSLEIDEDSFSQAHWTFLNLKLGVWPPDLPNMIKYNYNKLDFFKIQNWVSGYKICQIWSIRIMQ